MKMEEDVVDANSITEAGDEIDVLINTPTSPRRTTRRCTASKKFVALSESESDSTVVKRKRRSKSTRGPKPRKRGRQPRTSNTPTSQSKTTKARMSGGGKKDSYSYTDLFLDDDEQDVDENVDAGDDNDSEYAPSDEDVARRIAYTPKQRKGVSAATRRSSKTNSILNNEGSTDEDEAGESETESDDDDDEEGANGGTVTNGPNLQLFEDELNHAEHDIYDFDAQSIISDKRGKMKKRISSSAIVTRSANLNSTRSSRRTTEKSTNWGSNIYSALAAALKTRADLDAYSTFLKSNVLNNQLDQYLAATCKPSAQHANLFYGASESLQSLMSRINDHDKVVELLHAFVSKQFNQLQHRVVCLVPIIHQPIFGIGCISPIIQNLDALTKTIDEDMVVRPGYVLNEDINLLAVNSCKLADFGVSAAQYNCVTGSGNLGRYMPDMRTLVITSDLYQRLSDFVSLPPERIYEIALARAHQQLQEEEETDENDIDISPLEPPNLQRLVLAVNSSGSLVGLAILDTWNHTDVPHGRQRFPIDLFETANKSGTVLVPKPKGAKETTKQTVEDQVREVLNNIVDWVVFKCDPKDSSSQRRVTKQEDNVVGSLHFMDGFLVKPNGRRDSLLLMAHRNTCYPPLEGNFDDGSDGFRVYSLLDESKFALEKHGFTPDMPIVLDEVHSIDLEEVLEDKSVLVVPDLLFDTLRKVMLRELVTSCGTAAAAAVTSSRLENNNFPLNTSGSAAMIHCSKFVILDRQRRVPLAIAFDSPVRLTLQVFSDKIGFHPCGLEASTTFDQVTPSELRMYESTFKPTTAEYRLVAINGLLFGLQIDDKCVIRRILELAPARYNGIFPNIDNPSACAQSASAGQYSCPSNVRIVNDETNSSTVLPALYYPYYEINKLGGVITGFTDHLCSLLFELPVSVSLYDIVLRMAQKYMPELLAKQHIEAAEAAAYAEAAANPHAPPPAPVPLPEHWGVCCLCAKELRSLNGLLDHEMRHLGLTRFRCGVHNICFIDRLSWQFHMTEYHGNRGSGIATLNRSLTTPHVDSGSDQEDDDIQDHNDTPGRGLAVGLANVFNTGLLTGRMEAPQCEKCADHFLSAETLAQHLDFCDGVSFSVRCPLSRSNKSMSNEESEKNNLDGTMESDDACICGICGTQVPSREKILRHFTTHHLQCIVCSETLRFIEELSCHYHMHLKSEKDVSSTNEASNDSGNDRKQLISKILTCDICANFFGTKYNYYFHQWNDHGVVHPSTASINGMPLPVSQPRVSKFRLDKDDINTSVRRIRCKVCDFVVRVNGKEYMQHLLDKHNISIDAELICRICADLFDTPELLSAHLSATHVASGEYSNAGGQTIFRCTNCEFWGFAKGLLKHALEVHGDSAPAIYECVHCFERFSDKRLWRSHLDKHTERYSHRCTECGRAFRLRSSLVHHMRNHHGDDQGPATCDYCGLTYPKRSSLRYHIFRMHNQELAHECFMCQRRFRLETELRRHVKEMHSGAVKCEICHKVCTNLRCYSQHRQKHFRTRIYQCTDCQTTFKSKLAMKRHIRIEHLQLGPEKFECQICGKIVTQIGMHMLIHKEARFECEYCGKRFTKAAYYNEHLRIHRGEQPFECHICQKRFNKKSNLNVHLKFHEKHRDEEGNYLELKPRGRISTMFGDALMSPSDRAARQAAIRAGNLSFYVPKVDVSVGNDFPGAFNCTGPAGAAEEAASRIAELYGIDNVGARAKTSNNLFGSSGMVELTKLEPFYNPPHVL